MSATIKKHQFGEHFKSLREMYGMSQLDVAVTASLSQSTIEHIEKGQRKSPKLITILKMLSIFPLTPIEILYALGYEVTTEQIQHKILQNRYLESEKSLKVRGNNEKGKSGKRLMEKGNKV